MTAALCRARFSRSAKGRASLERVEAIPHKAGFRIGRRPGGPRHQPESEPVLEDLEERLKELEGQTLAALRRIESSRD